MPAKTTVRPDWKRHSICDAEDFHLFFGQDGESKAKRLIREERAKEICRMCPAVDPCLAFALEGNEAAGVWGALGEDERKTERRRRMRGAAAQAARAKQEQAAREAEESRARSTKLFQPADPARDLELLRESEKIVAAGKTVTDAAYQMGMPRSSLRLARTRAQALLAEVS